MKQEEFALPDCAFKNERLEEKREVPRYTAQSIWNQDLGPANIVLIPDPNGELVKWLDVVDRLK